MPEGMTEAHLPDGLKIHCVNAYEVDFSINEIFSENLTSRGINLPPQSVILDVGANIGLFALFLRQEYVEPNIIAFEPMPAPFKALESNMKTYMPSARCFNIALGAAPGQVEFDYFPDVSALSTAHSEVGLTLAKGLKNLLQGGHASDEVRQIIDRTSSDNTYDEEFINHLFRTEKVNANVDTLSNQIMALGLERVDLLKIDTEGSELEILAGISDEHWPRIANVFVEVHIGRDQAEILAADFRKRGFSTEIGDHPLSQGGAPVYHVYASR